MDTEITVSIPVKQAIQTHVEHLQATLAKRNEQIERLTERVKEAEAGEPNQRALDAAFKRGWQSASGHLMEVTRQAAIDLGRVRKNAWDIYLESEKRDFDGYHTDS
jgi:phage terminase large subunit GpA-like protein